MFNNNFRLVKKNNSSIKLRTRCRICSRSRYLVYLRPSVTHVGKWICQDDVDCLNYLNYKTANCK